MTRTVSSSSRIRFPVGLKVSSLPCSIRGSVSCFIASRTRPSRMPKISSVPFGQGFKDMSTPTKELMKLALEGRIAHGGLPVLSWMMDNIHVRTDPAGNIKPDKEKSTEKIDGAVAMIMVLDKCIRNKGAQEQS